MKKNKIYVITIVILLVLNLVQLGMTFFMKGPPPPFSKGFDPIEILHLNSEQKDKFKKYADTHHEKMDAIQQKQRVLTEKYFNNPTDSLKQEIKVLELEKISLTNAHFQDIKSILEPNQLSYFDDFKKKAVHLIIK